ncbi:MAG: 2-C-methyl-D-erythritol 4-phosphate cytidylyltransferase [Burkholderiaceae bacterium]
MPESRSPRYFAVVPAGGTGTRVGASVPKQYLELAGRTVIEHAVSALIEAPWIERVVVVTAPGDSRAARVLRDTPRVQISATGGATRRDSVLAGLRALAALARDDDWVLVHDAARPGLTLASLERLRAELSEHPVGGLLALPVADTVKREDARGCVAETVPRSGLWLAQTPQMARAGTLRRALEAHSGVTDEAAALEAQGLAPRLVEGERRNFKVTTAEDLALMDALLVRATERMGRLR